ncbi:MAG: peptide deformylase [Planctomycetota bacterium]|jgi:peptide deformylase
MTDDSKYHLTKYPTPVLMTRAKPVEVFDDSLRVLAEQMIKIMVETKGVGLAGPQAGVNLRIFVASIDGTRENAKVYVNPAIKVRIYQHEYDHLEGRMIKDRLGTAAKIRAKRRLKQLEEEYEQTHNENS